jgi:ribonuclease HI
MSDFDLDSLMNDDFNLEEKTEVNEFSPSYLNSFNLIFFTDGSCLGNGKDSADAKNKAGFGIYIMNNNKDSIYFGHNDTKILKKIDKDFIMFNKNTYDTIYYNLTHKNETDTKCYNEGCTYYGIYTTDSNKKCPGYCKSHKQDGMELNNNYFQYSATNIRAEGYAILYALAYIKFLHVDNINDKYEITRIFKLDKINNLKNNLKVINFNKKSVNKFLIVTDSKFWIDLITKWCNSWIKKGLTFDKKNVDLIIMINHYMHILSENNIEIVFKHIHGHADKDKKAELNIYQKGNVMSDKLANIANDSKNLALRIV